MRDVKPFDINWHDGHWSADCCCDKCYAMFTITLSDVYWVVDQWYPFGDVSLATSYRRYYVACPVCAATHEHMMDALSGYFGFESLGGQGTGFIGKKEELVLNTLYPHHRVYRGEGYAYC